MPASQLICRRPDAIGPGLFPLLGLPKAFWKSATTPLISPVPLYIVGAASAANAHPINAERTNFFPTANLKCVACFFMLYLPIIIKLFCMI